MLAHLTRLTQPNIFFHPASLYLLLGFFAIRGLSFWLFDHEFIQAILVVTITCIFGILYFTKREWAWLILLTEFFLGGAGHFLQFADLSLRTILTGTFVFLWLFFTIYHRSYHDLHIPHMVRWLIGAVLVYILFAAGRGLYLGHTFSAVVHDIVPFLYLLFLIPMHRLLGDSRHQAYVLRLITTFIIGSAIFALFTYMLYVSGTSVLHDTYYTWFREIAAGKITAMTPWFYRVVTPEHLLLAPLGLLIMSLLMRDERHHKMWRVLYGAIALTLALNFSRGYFLALAVGALVLLYKHRWKKWLRVTAWAAAALVGIFLIINLVASGGAQTGSDLLFGRLHSIGDPTTETSSATRLLLLKPIQTLILAAPIFGNGLGATITYVDPNLFAEITTTSFDWGYLEMWAELGMVGGLLYLTLISVTIWEAIKKIRAVSDYHDLYVGWLAGLVGLLVINLTSPALFHVFGVLYLVSFLAFVTKPPEVFHEVVTRLYRLFNRSR